MTFTIPPMLTTGIETLEVFYAHTVSPVCIAALVSAAVQIFVGCVSSWYLSLVALAAYIVIGIVGESGCGKSTFLKLLLRFWQKDGGSIAYKMASVHNFIMTLPDGYKTRVGALGDNLSAGEK